MALDFLNLIQKDMERWPGQPIEVAPFIKQIKAINNDQVIFWCFQVPDEFLALAEALGDEVSLYALRSGHMFMDYNEVNIDQLTDVFVKQIIAVCKLKGINKFLLGGNCQGATLILRAAEKLQNYSNLSFSLVVLESIYPYKLDLPITLIFGRNSSYNLYRRFHHVDGGLSRFYNDYKVIITPGAHGQFFSNQNVSALARIIRKSYIHRNLAEKVSVIGNKVFITESLLASLKINKILMPQQSLASNSHFRVELILKNTGFDALPARQITISNQWYEAESKKVYKWLDSVQYIPELIANQEIKLELQLTAPFSAGEYLLGFRLALEGERYLELDAQSAVSINLSQNLLTMSTPRKSIPQRIIICNFLRFGMFDCVLSYLAEVQCLTRRQWLLIIELFVQDARWSDVMTLCEALKCNKGFDARFVAAYMDAALKINMADKAIAIFDGLTDKYGKKIAELNNKYLYALLNLGQIDVVYRNIFEDENLITNNVDNLLMSMLAPHNFKKMTLDEIVNCVNKLYSLNKSSESFLKMTGVLLVNQLNEQALKLLLEAIELFPQNATFLLRIARLKNEQNVKSEAKFFFEKVLFVAPNNHEAASWLNTND